MSKFKTSKLEVVKSAAQLFTASWADAGSEINVSGVSKLAVYLELDRSDSADMRIRPLALLEKGASDEYQFSIKTVGASDVKLEDLYYEFNSDVDGKYMFEIDIQGGMQAIQFQIMVGTIGAGTAQLEHLKVMKIYSA